MNRETGTLAARTTPRIHSIRGGADACASPAAVLQAIGRATGHWSARRRPDDAMRRTAVGVVAAIAELVREVRPEFGGEPWTIEVPCDLAEAGRRAGFASAEAEAALPLLLEAGCVVVVEAGRERRLRLGEEVFADHPALARIQWEAVRRRLDAAGGSRAPALAVLRELAVWSGHPLPGDVGPWVEVSLSRLMDGTLFRRTAVSRALSDLERASLISRAPRAGREHSCRVAPAAFGNAEPPPAAAPAAPTAAPAPPAAHAPAVSGAVVALRFGTSEVRVHDGLVCEVRPGTDGVPVLEIRPIP